MKRTRTNSAFVVGIIAIAAMLFSCSSDEEAMMHSSRGLLATLDSSLIYPPNSESHDNLNKYTKLKVYARDKDGNDILTELIGDNPWDYSWYIEYKGCHFYELHLGPNPVPEPDWAKNLPEGFKGGAGSGYDSYDPKAGHYVVLGGLQPEFDEIETATFHWKDGTSDKVEFMALKNNEYPDMLPRYYMVYFLNGKQTAFPIVIVR